ncbi:hypothetical protein L1279_001195 [Planomicrobium sp. HSC-17F08]|nr:hypothetical protein [Planomicrobium sp. HSC-17F08]
MEEVMDRLDHWELKASTINPDYKVKHGGFGWLNAEEWLELVNMHSRHHLRQKEELERYLKMETLFFSLVYSLNPQNCRRRKHLNRRFLDEILVLGLPE